MSAVTLTAIRADGLDLPEVRVILTPAKGKAIEAALGVGPLIVGTDPACEIAVDDPHMSRRHCELRLADGGVLIRDLGSKNGTRVNDVGVVEAWLRAKDRVSVGSCQLALKSSGKTLPLPLSREASFGGALGGSVPMRALFAKLARVAPTEETVLLLGDSGTGKEVLARAIHDASPRSDGPLVVLDCAAAPPTLLEAELFGHERGAFTGAVGARAGLLEEARGGTLFIDEIGDLAPELQPKLLRVLESRQFRRLGEASYRAFEGRVVAATHRDLRRRIGEGLFREDLYYRLAVAELRVPPLAERREDIPLLVERFLAAQRPPRGLADLPPTTIEMLMAHSWPGNVRELRNTVTRLVLFPGAEGAIATPSAGREDPFERLRGMTLREARDLVIEDFERRFLEDRLREKGGNVVLTAESIGVSRQFVYRLIERYGLR